MLFKKSIYNYLKYLHKVIKLKYTNQKCQTNNFSDLP